MNDNSSFQDSDGSEWEPAVPEMEFPPIIGAGPAAKSSCDLPAGETGGGGDLEDVLAGPVKRLGRWLLWRNPFYLVSAALVLYAAYRLSVDSEIFASEISKVLFNFGSLHVYEILLVGTAIFLARRRIQYDSALLIALEHVLVLVPFILVSQAILISGGMAWGLCGMGVALAVVRFAALGRFCADWPVQRGLMAAGLFLLAANVAFPVIFREVHKTYDAVTGNVRLDAWSFWCWLLVLPMFLALVNLVTPFQARPGGVRFPRLLPLLLFASWMAVTVVHLYSIGYVYGLEWRAAFLAPLFWVAAWTVVSRVGVFLPEAGAWTLRIAGLLPVAVIAFAGWHFQPGLFAALNGLNAVCYGLCVWKRLNPVMSLQLMLASAVAALAGAPVSWTQAAPMQLDRLEIIGGAIVFYVAVCAVLTRSPRLGIAGAIAWSIGLINAVPAVSFNIGMQIGIVFLLLHSFRWRDDETEGASAARAIAAVLWLLHSGCWLLAAPSSALIPVAVIAFVTLVICVVVRVIIGNWRALVVPATAVAVLLLGPGMIAVEVGKAAPVGLLALGASLGLFALGTLLALNRERMDAGGQEGRNAEH